MVLVTYTITTYNIQALYLLISFQHQIVMFPKFTEHWLELEASESRSIVFCFACYAQSPLRLARQLGVNQLTKLNPSHTCKDPRLIEILPPNFKLPFICLSFSSIHYSLLLSFSTEHVFTGSKEIESKQRQHVRSKSNLRRCNKLKL
eukprot:scaffold1093_cov107-Skeletonema_dohrnii-CCMP3373.AAC.4